MAIRFPTLPPAGRPAERTVDDVPPPAAKPAGTVRDASGWSSAEALDARGAKASGHPVATGALFGEALDWRQYAPSRQSVRSDGVAHGEPLRVDGPAGTVLDQLSARLKVKGEWVSPHLSVLRTDLGTDAAGRFERTVLKLEGTKAELELRTYPAHGVTVAELQGHGETLDPKKGVQLAMSLPGFKEGKALYQWKTHWTADSLPKSVSEIPAESQFLLYRQGNEFQAMVPLSGAQTTSVLGSENGQFRIQAAPHAPDVRAGRIPLFAVASGSNPYGAIRSVMRTGFAATGQHGALRTEKAFPKVFDGLGYCTWESLHGDLSPKAILPLLEQMKAAGTPARYLLMDDGWAQYHGRQLHDVKADPEKFPDGLKGFVAQAKALGVRDVGVWLAFNGHWEGLSENSPLAQRHPMLRCPDGSLVPDPDHAQEFWADVLGQLKDAGVTFVKIDNQARMGGEILRGVRPSAEAGTKSLQGLQRAAAERGIDVLSCMSLGSELVHQWNHSAVVRSSDDWLPDNEERSKLLERHVTGNTFTLGETAYPDGDMFKTDDELAHFHALTRAMSAGPIYVSDSPGKTHGELLAPFTREDGTLFRLAEPGVQTMDQLFTDLSKTPTVQKRFAHVQADGYAAGVLGLANVTDGAREVTGALKASDVFGWEDPTPSNGARYAVLRRDGSPAQLLDAAHPSQPVRLGQVGADLATLVPVSHGVAPFGLVDKYLSALGVEQFRAQPGEAKIRLAQRGDFAAWMDAAPREVRVDGKVLPEGAYAFEASMLTIPRGAFGPGTGPMDVEFRTGTSA